MDRCPPELHSYICSLACTDDGLTARSLLLVSKYFYQVSFPYLYQSLAVSGQSQLTAVTRRLENVPAYHRRIRHLYLSDFSEDDTLKYADIVNTIHRLLEIASPTVETLTFIAHVPYTSTSLIARLFRLVYPRLHELTVSGHYPFCSSTFIPFPALERLHLVGNRNPHGLLHLGALEVCAPKLTHLRISGLNYATSFSQELHRAFFTCDEDDPLFPVKLPPRLQHLLVQCGHDYPSKPSTGAQLKNRVMMENFKTLQERVVRDHHSTRFTVLPTVTSMTASELWQHWASRLRGGYGCWEGDETKS